MNVLELIGRSEELFGADIAARTRRLLAIVNRIHRPGDPAGRIRSDRARGLGLGRQIMRIVTIIANLHKLR